MASASSEIGSNNNLDFICHYLTARYLQRSNTMIILRGLPGSGKSTMVKGILSAFKDAVVCSADNFFYDADGIYTFDATKLSAAHEQCQGRATQACKDKATIVIIDNTNICRWEMKFYFTLCSTYSYVTIVLSPTTPWCLNPEELAKRNKHKVPADIIEKKVIKFKNEYVGPLYYAWFLNAIDSVTLLETVSKYFDSCLEGNKEFDAYIRNNTLSDVVVDGKNSWDKKYSRNNSSSQNLHCTAYFAGRDKSDETIEYAKKDVVQENMGKVTEISIVGLMISPRTFGARVKLTSEQLKMWERGTCEASSKSNCEACFEHPESVFHPTCGLGSRAHITLGYTKGTNAVQTGLDQIKLLELEVQNMDINENVSVENASIKYYDQGQCIVYFNKPIKIPSLFSGKYV